MKEKFQRHETLYVILIIVGYVVVASYCLQNFGLTDVRSVLLHTAMSIALLALVRALGRGTYYGLTGVQRPGRYLYFLPLAVIASVNLWNGAQVQNSPGEILCHILVMVNVGFLEELIFRGFLFRMMEKDNVKSAVAVSALTFGVGHIVNLLNGADLVPTLLQVCYAVAIGFAFVMVFYRSGSLIPCILAHMVTNALSIFGVENDRLMYLGSGAIVVIGLGYALYLGKALREAPKPMQTEQ